MRELSALSRQVIGKTMVVLALSVPCTLAGAQQNREIPNCEKAPLNLDQVLNNLEQKNAERAAALEQFEGRRVYRMEYRGVFSERNAEMVVKVRFRAPSSKEFTILSESGSKFVIDHVFKKLLEGEQEATTGDNRYETALNRQNYSFELVGYENAAEGPRYVLTVTPKTRNKFLYRGRIWVDAKDFAVVRIEGEPGKNPSMWITKTDFAHKYVKVDDFWLPAENYTETAVRWGGKSTLSIEYQDYKILKASRLHIVETARIDRSSFSR
jgi:outer membrane lipoprotein-sorting protein